MSAAISPLPPRRAGTPTAVRLARLLGRERRLDEAEMVLARTRPAASDQLVFATETARILQAQRRYAAAESSWRDALARVPNDPHLRQGLVQALRLRHRFADAERELGELPADGTGARILTVEAARLAAQREAYAEAVRRYHAALAQPGPGSELLDELAAVWVAQHRFAVAEAVLGQLARAEPRQVGWLVSLARAAEEKGDLDLAQARWREVLELDAMHLRARVALGRLREELGQPGEAESIYRDLTETHAGRPEPYYQLGRLALAQSDLAAAATWLARAVAVDPADWPSRAAMARLTAEQTRFGRACQMARELVAEAPDHLDAYLLLAWVEERAGRPLAALRTLRDCCARFEQAFAAPLKLAELQMRRGESGSARATLEAAHAHNPETFSIRLALADARFATADQAAAAAAVEALYEDYPEHREVKKRLARLEVIAERYGPARRLWREVTRFDRRLAGPPLNLERLDERPIPPAGTELRLFSRIRNEYPRLPWLLDFYRSQGVDRFFIVDNGSDDGSRDYLLGRPDTHLFLTTDSYAVYGGGMRWLNHLLQHFGSGGWCLTVDVDEVFAYPHAERLDLKALTQHLDRRGAGAMFAFMLDMYAEDCLETATYAPGDNPLALCPCFDRSGYIRREHPDFPFRLVTGGLVSRFFYGGKQEGVYLHKVPLVRWDEDMRYTSSTHTLFPVPLAAETGVLLHLKYTADFVDRARIEAQRRQYWQGAKRYAVFNRRLAGATGVNFRCALTERFTSTAQLAALGLIQSSSALDELAWQEGRQEPLPGWPAAAAQG